MDMTVDTWIALIALLFSVIFGAHSIRTSRRLNTLAEQNAEYELRGHQEADKQKRRANLQLRIVRHPDQIILSNAGEGLATDVYLTVRSSVGERDPIKYDGDRKLPLARIGPGEECSFGASIFWEYDTAFHCDLTWRDLDGVERRDELTLHT